MQDLRIQSQPPPLFLMFKWSSEMILFHLLIMLICSSFSHLCKQFFCGRKQPWDIDADLNWPCWKSGIEACSFLVLTANAGLEEESMSTCKVKELQNQSAHPLSPSWSDFALDPTTGWEKISHQDYIQWEIAFISKMIRFINFLIPKPWKFSIGHRCSFAFILFTFPNISQRENNAWTEV